MDIKLNAPIECLDENHCGHVSGVIINPDTDALTHLVVRTADVERVVPVALIRESTPSVVVLNCTAARLKEQQALIETEYIRSTVDHYDYVPLGEATVEHVPTTFTVEHEMIPMGEEEIKRGAAVFAKDGRIGRVDDIVVDPTNHHITHIILRKGHLWGAKEVTVGVKHIKAIDDDGITLKISKAQVELLPPSPANADKPTRPQASHLDITVNALVHCTDGDYGHTTCLIVNPINDDITHFVVDNHQPNGQRIVPVSFITGTTAYSITVNCDCAALANQPNFIAHEYDRPEATKLYADYMFWPIMLPEDARVYPASPYHAFEYEQIPAGELAVRRGMAVYAAAETNGDKSAEPIHIGQVEAFLADPTTGHITHLILREGHLWGQREVTIPVNAIGKIEVSDVQLILTPQQVEALPSVPVKHWMPFIA